MRTLIPCILLTLLASAYAAPAGSGGGGSSPADDTSLEGWFALGAAALVAGILIWDIFRDSGDESAPPETPAGETGVDWAALQPVPTLPVVLGVSVLPGHDGWHTAQYLQKLLLPLEDHGFRFGGDPVDFGRLPPHQQARMAMDFLGYTWFLAAGDSCLLLYTGHGEPSWERSLPGWDSLSVRNAALDLLTAAPALQ